MTGIGDVNVQGPVPWRIRHWLSKSRSSTPKAAKLTVLPELSTNSMTLGIDMDATELPDS